MATIVTLPGLAHAVFVRSPHAHARIVAIDTAAALAAPGVLAVLTGADYRRRRARPIPHNRRADGTARRARCGWRRGADRHARITRCRPTRCALSASRWRWSSPKRSPRRRTPPNWSTVAYEPLPAVARAADAVKPGAPCLWDEAPGNICIDIEVGDAGRDRRRLRARRACRAARHLDPARHRRADGAAHHRSPNTTRRPAITRSTPAAAAASPRCRLDLAAGARRAAPSRCACVCGDMGGNFGTRNFFYPEYALLPWAAQRVGRPVKWTCERSEDLPQRLSGPRPHRRGRAGARRGRQVPRRARHQPEQSRRPCRRRSCRCKRASA